MLIVLCCFCVVVAVVCCCRIIIIIIIASWLHRHWCGHFRLQRRQRMQQQPMQERRHLCEWPQSLHLHLQEFVVLSVACCWRVESDNSWCLLCMVVAGG